MTPRRPLTPAMMRTRDHARQAAPLPPAPAARKPRLPGAAEDSASPEWLVPPSARAARA